MAAKKPTQASARKQATTLALFGFVAVFAVFSLFTLPSFQDRSQARDRIGEARSEADAQAAKRDQYLSVGGELERVIATIRAADGLLPFYADAAPPSLPVNSAISEAVTAAGAEMTDPPDAPAEVAAPALPAGVRAYRSEFTFRGTLTDLEEVIASLDTSGQLMAISGVGFEGNLELSDSESDFRAPVSQTSSGFITVTAVFFFSTRAPVTELP